MHATFIGNHQFNAIKKQTDILLQALRTASDRNVLKAVRYSASLMIDELFPGLEDERKRQLSAMSEMDAAEQFQRYLDSLEPWREEFPAISNKQLQKLFPKAKKLNAPDVDAMDRRRMTYLGWTDIATGKMFLVYPVDGQLTGLEGRYTPVNKKGYCLICNGHEELALFTVKTRPANSPPDYYKAFGHYVCIDSDACNRRITDTAALEKFLHTIKRG
ncbi:FusB/FusC family EF-G-binding protein [Paenibacillus glycinis]|uniref:Elongation factor G-binding protein n=1 Tax=Paenibacillus glycinis TaxID=2697035 RepID=A0ABW9XLA0_9BACL|nr:FusB/FusC family EF-G-binding protein [Paenibacillus glycinis]NBD23276.1 elongation factor G-binding protein [Paenibacillus glycinis]